MIAIFRSSLAVLFLLCAGCGFQLRESVALNPLVKRLRIESVDQFSVLPQELGRALLRSGVELVEADDTDSSVLRILSDSQITQPLTFSGAARVQEFLVVHRVEIEVLDAAGKPLLAKTLIERERDYRFDETLALGAAAEDELARNELRRDMVQAILRRIEAVGE
ncbi:MAG: LPS assembly lipoprotein LptE [Lysobacterales bacterium]